MKGLDNILLSSRRPLVSGRKGSTFTTKLHKTKKYWCKNCLFTVRKMAGIVKKSSLHVEVCYCCRELLCSAVSTTLVSPHSPIFQQVAILILVTVSCWRSAEERADKPPAQPPLQSQIRVGWGLWARCAWRMIHPSCRPPSFRNLTAVIATDPLSVWVNVSARDCLHVCICHVCMRVWARVCGWLWVCVVYRYVCMYVLYERETERAQVKGQRVQTTATIKWPKVQCQPDKTCMWVRCLSVRKTQC